MNVSDHGSVSDLCGDVRAHESNNSENIKRDVADLTSGLCGHSRRLLKSKREGQQAAKSDATQQHKSNCTPELLLLRLRGWKMKR